MKKLVLMLSLAVFACATAFASVDRPTVASFSNLPEVSILPAELQGLDVQDFLAMTPARYRELTGERMGVKNALALKAAQRKVEKAMKPLDADIEKNLYVVLAIFGLAWVAMGLMDDWSGKDWVTNLILTVLCWIPGLIHAFSKMDKYYPD
ncbi:MAG: YqaE/Pmp3 family membrane protein [Bacteroidia bacterium]|nr:YqaE/Pmp3 family membrane protein [Bacteroidia bacterium]